MKKKIVLTSAIICHIIVLTLGVFLGLVFIVFKAWDTPNENDRFEQEIVEKESKIDYFLEQKSANNSLVLGKNDSINYIDVNDYYLDVNDSTYSILKNASYNELDSVKDDLKALYILGYKQIEHEYDKRAFGTRYVLCSNGVFMISAYHKGSVFYSASKVRYYKIDENSYNKLLNKVISETEKLSLDDILLNDTDGKLIVEKESKIDFFLKEKNENNSLVIGKNGSNKLLKIDDYYQDVNNSVYSILETAEYDELDSKYDSQPLYSFGYKITYYDYDEEKYDSKYILYSNGIIVINAIHKSSVTSTKTRYYKMDDNSFNELVDKIEMVVSETQKI